jgi:hypothetical protein
MKFICALRNESGGCDNHVDKAETAAPKLSSGH